MHVFYTPDIAVNPELPEEEAGHCLRVLRLTVGDEVMLTDGKMFLPCSYQCGQRKTLSGESDGNYSSGAFLERTPAPGYGSYEKYGPYRVVCGKGYRDRIR